MLCFSPRLEMGPVWWISCTWEQYIELHVCPALRRDTFLFHMFVQLRDPRKPNSGVCLRRQIGIVLCACKCLPPPCLPQPLCVCVCVHGGTIPRQTHSHPSQAKEHKHKIFICPKPTGWKCSFGGVSVPLGLGGCCWDKASACQACWAPPWLDLWGRGCSPAACPIRPSQRTHGSRICPSGKGRSSPSCMNQLGSDCGAFQLLAFKGTCPFHPLCCHSAARRPSRKEGGFVDKIWGL